MSTQATIPGVHYVRTRNVRTKTQKPWTQSPIYYEFKMNIDWQRTKEDAPINCVVFPQEMIDELIEVIPPDLRYFDSNSCHLTFLGYRIVPQEELEGLC